MANPQCVVCGARRGRRECPAKGAPICSRCCGEKRIVEFPCPAECPYLGEHEGYQGRRTLQGESVWRKRYQDALGVSEGTLTWTLLLDRAIYQHLRDYPATPPPDVARAMEFLRSKASPLITPTHPTTAIESALQEVMQSWRTASGGRPPADWDELPSVIDRSIPFFRSTLAGQEGIREFLRSVAGILEGEPALSDDGSPRREGTDSHDPGGRIVIP